MSNKELETISRYGATVKKSCQYDLRRLSSNNPYDLPETSEYLYELFLENSDGSLIDVPVAVQNVELNSSPNDAAWTLTRRFFITDTISGIDTSNSNVDQPFLERSPPSVVRYPKSITLRTNLDVTGKHESIFSPVLKIYYRSRSSEDIEDDPLATVSFTAEYSMDTGGFWSTEYSLFIIANILAVIVIISKLISLIAQGNLGDDDFGAKCKYFFFRLFVDSFEVYSNIMYWFLFIMITYWYTFFKWQKHVFILLPPLNTHTENYKPFDIIFAVVASFKLTSIINKILIKQTQFDIFMIDWERPKCQYTDNKGNLQVGQNGWRQIFLMNEFCELQMYKFISIEFTLIAYLVVFEGLGLRNWANHDPNVTN